jgi:Cd2+-exporting ATPase
VALRDRELGAGAIEELLALINQGITLLCVTLDSTPVAAFGLKSNIRNEATAVVADLTRRNIRCHIVSGDGPRVVEDVAQAVGIPSSNTASRHSPAEKQKYVEGLMSAGNIVLFCGDGTNDAVAVAQANVGVQIGVASDVTRVTADVVLLGGLDGVPVLLDLSTRAFRRINFNFVWSAIYNVFAILLAGGAFVKVRIPPAYAGLGEIVSDCPVIIAAMTLTRA